MNLRQIRYISEIAKRGLNISAVAAALHTHQPGISKQVKQLEEELGMEIFLRSRNRLSGITPQGKLVIAMADRIMAEVANMKAAGADVTSENTGPLVIAVTHTQARYVLPDIIRRFTARFPGVQLTMRHADPRNIRNMVLTDVADIGMIANDPVDDRELAVLPCVRSPKCVIAPKGHPILREKRLTLRHLAQYPLVTYEPGFTARRQVVDAFEKEGLRPKMVVSAINVDVIKSYVEHGVGIAVIPDMAFDAARDIGLRSKPAGHLFPPSTSYIVLSRQRYLRRYAFELIEMCDARWTRGRVQAILRQ